MITFRQVSERKLWIIAVILFITFYFVYSFNYNSFGLISDVFTFQQKSETWIFQDNEEKDYPTSYTDVQRIPHIIHHYYSSEFVPEKYVPYMRSFRQMNPTWDYRFWSFISGRQLIEKHHPYLLEKYDCLGKTVQNSNMIRYIVLFQYGGVYTDLDVEDLRPLDKIALKYSCIFPPEPFEHAVLSYKMEYTVQTATVMCRKSHPFLKFILNSMRDISCTAPTQFNTGPGFVSKQFRLFHDITKEEMKKKRHFSDTNSPFFYRGGMKEDDLDAVYVPNTQYFSDNVAQKVIRKLNIMCKFYYIQSYNNRRACNEFNRRKRLRKNKTFAFLNHDWFNSYNAYKKRYFLEMRTVHIREIVLDSILYGEKENETSA